MRAKVKLTERVKSAGLFNWPIFKLEVTHVNAWEMQSHVGTIWAKRCEHAETLLTAAIVVDEKEKKRIKGDGNLVAGGLSSTTKRAHGVRKSGFHSLDNIAGKYERIARFLLTFQDLKTLADENSSDFSHLADLIAKLVVDKFADPTQIDLMNKTPIGFAYNNDRPMEAFTRNDVLFEMHELLDVVGKIWEVGIVGEACQGFELVGEDSARSFAGALVGQTQVFSHWRKVETTSTTRPSSTILSGTGEEREKSSKVESYVAGPGAGFPDPEYPNNVEHRGKVFVAPGSVVEILKIIEKKPKKKAEQKPEQKTAHHSSPVVDRHDTDRDSTTTKYKVSFASSVVQEVIDSNFLVARSEWKKNRFYWSKK